MVSWRTRTRRVIWWHGGTWLGRWRRFEFTEAFVRMASFRVGWSPEMVTTVAPVVTAMVVMVSAMTVTALPT